MPDIPYALLILLLALVLDLLAGELPNSVHPVALMGRMASWLEKGLPQRGQGQQLLAGVLITLLVSALFTGGAILLSGYRFGVISFVLNVIVLKSTFAMRALGQSAIRVRDALDAGQIEEARTAIMSLCSRDSTQLREPGLVSATVESLAENTSDSFVAPLFYFLLFGLPGAIFYRVVNTLDAMIGYHGRYEYLGKAAARLDDLLNYIPARLTAALLLLAGWFLSKDLGQGLRVWARDRKKTESPNAGRPMAVMAGLLKVTMEKKGSYRLGDPKETLSITKISEAWGVVTLCALLASFMAAVFIGVQHALVH